MKKINFDVLFKSFSRVSSLLAIGRALGISWALLRGPDGQVEPSPAILETRN